MVVRSNRVLLRLNELAYFPAVLLIPIVRQYEVQIGPSPNNMHKTPVQVFAEMMRKVVPGHKCRWHHRYKRCRNNLVRPPRPTSPGSAPKACAAVRRWCELRTNWPSCRAVRAIGHLMDP